MNVPMSSGLKRYCLEADPFFPKKSAGPLRLSLPDAAPVLLRCLDPGLHERLIQFLDKAVENRETGSAAFVLITGSHSTGKSLIAEYVMNSWFQRFEHPIPAIPVELQATNSSPIEMVKKWLQSLLDKSRRHLATPELAPLRERIARTCEKGSGELNCDMLHNATVDLVDALLNPVGSCVAAYFDKNSQSLSHAPAILSTALDVFTSAPMLFVATVPPDSNFDELRSKFEAEDQAGAVYFRIDLKLLRKADARHIIEERWKPGHKPCPLSNPGCIERENSVCRNLAEEHPSPFKNLDWTGFIEDKQYPIEVVLRGLAGILHRKSPPNKEGMCWPHDEALEITQEDFEEAWDWYQFFSTDGSARGTAIP